MGMTTERKRDTMSKRQKPMPKATHQTKLDIALQMFLDSGKRMTMCPPDHGGHILWKQREDRLDTMAVSHIWKKLVGGRAA